MLFIMLRACLHRREPDWFRWKLRRETLLEPGFSQTHPFCGIRIELERGTCCGLVGKAQAMHSRFEDVNFKRHARLCQSICHAGGVFHGHECIRRRCPQESWRYVFGHMKRRADNIQQLVGC